MLTHGKLVYKVEQTHKKAALWKLDGKRSKSFFSLLEYAILDFLPLFVWFRNDSSVRPSIQSLGRDHVIKIQKQY